MRTILFGHFRNEGGDPIEWQVLCEDKETLLVVTARNVAHRCFDEEYQTWAKSDIRSWLNGEFCDQAFSADEKRCIRPTEVEVFAWEGSVVEQTEDAVFLLSMEEAKVYCAALAPEAHQGSWWLRDSGECDSTAILVQQDGSFDVYASTHSPYGIRPAMRVIKNYEDLITPEIPILEGQRSLFDQTECFVEAHGKMGAELDQILAELDMNPLGNRRDFRLLKEVILLAVRYPNTWQARYLERIGKREGITRERVRQILYKAVWDHWNVRSAFVLSNHFGHPIQTQFERVKPTHIELVTLLAKELRNKHDIMPE